MYFPFNLPFLCQLILKTILYLCLREIDYYFYCELLSEFDGYIYMGHLRTFLKQ